MSHALSQFTLGFGGPDWTVERTADRIAWRNRRNLQRLAGIAV